MSGWLASAPPRVLKIAECADCEQHALAEPMLAGACASVGIEHGKSTAQMVRLYLAGYHERGHAKL